MRLRRGDVFFPVYSTQNKNCRKPAVYYFFCALIANQTSSQIDFVRRIRASVKDWKGPVPRPQWPSKHEFVPSEEA